MVTVHIGPFQQTLYLFQTNPIGLRLTVFPEVELIEQGLGKGAMATFSKQSELGMQLHTANKPFLGEKNIYIHTCIKCHMCS